MERMMFVNKNIKKIVVTALMCALFSCMASLNVLAAPKYVNITGEPVVVREKPGTSQKSLTKVHYGDQLVYVGQKKDKKGVYWYQIKLADNKKGWVTSALSQTVDEKDIGRVEVTTKLLNVREKASLKSNVLGITRIGSQFDYFSEVKDSSGQTWYRVHYGENKLAWLLGTYCKVVKKQGDSDSVPDSKTKGKQVEITASPVNVRSAASLKASRIGTTSKGKKYKYLDSDVEQSGRVWYQIQYTAKETGWVLGSLSKTSDDGDTSSTTSTTKTTSKTTAKTASKQVKVTSSILNVRSSASYKGKILTTVKKGKTFKYISSKKDSDGRTWYQIEYKSGKKGWVVSKYTKLTGDTTTKTKTAEKKVKITGSKVVVRASAGKSGKKIAMVKKGNTFKYLSTKKDAKGKTWYQIQYTSKTKGCVMGSLSKIVEAKATTKATTATTKKAAKKVEIIESPVRVRESASTSSKKLGTTSEGKMYEYLATKKDANNRIWYQIQYTSKTKGWVLGKFCKLV